MLRVEQDSEVMRERRDRVRPRPARIEVPKAGQESVWSYPRPPRIEAVAVPVRVDWGGVMLGRSGRAVRVVETSSPPVYYLPPEDVRTDLLTPGGASSVCEWKGEARYWNVERNDLVVADAAWSYPTPWCGFEAIADFLAFYVAKMDACYVGDERAAPQPGGFYGGWVTGDLVGPFKGIAGSEAW
jgi:uncharacterized protein (DUF427 family)